MNYINEINSYISQWISEASLPHLILHGMMLIFIIYLLSMRPFKPRPNDKLTEREEEELIREWKPIPLAKPMTRMMIRNASNPIVITGAECGKGTNLVEVNGKPNILHMARTNYLGLIGDPRIEAVCKDTIRKYGVGSCGPRGFYGTIDVHMSLEARIAKFMKAEQAILYSSGYATISSTIPSFAKVGDVIFADAGLNQAIQVGLTLSRSRIIYFKHNDIADLARLLEEAAQKDQGKGKLARKFVVIEGIYFNTGDVCALPQIMALKERYKFRIIMEESHSIGVLGGTGRGITEHYGIDISEIEMITASLGNAFASGGGFCVGSNAVIFHQRLNGVGFVFSASLPPFLATAAETAIDILDKERLLNRLATNIKLFYDKVNISNEVPLLTVTSSPISPVVHLRLKQSSGNRDDDDDLLEKIVVRALDNGVLFTRAKYCDSERFLPAPSIRICINSSMTNTEIQQAIDVLKMVTQQLLQSSKI